ncbi:L-serine ammonia-lyase, iron-sulfur-dependent, subunit alpha [Herbinix luporum]|jgi:L-serine dehydratase|uniref:L-serine dehydratase n=1 Tax=Herbinix luporum TaxID=1679721 RepID=A0A0K8J6W2_9FIRM|nr:L-serine ammonia-lyase, iron-sulfur-dependent, subunit alpha [Herbinix luporum]MDI9489729.1 L-serine ammonia-lyase, iron-sulfur-dependent, subunit alpha [Bacillota bacterium]CUH93245.1 putative L-serine dehydratase, alpha chain [Herbinix luporum]HHT57793.1 L-serine ammonia-lyase, iron-sulfur-dependent, subunit alpha [Herbinix luporum]
MSFRSFEEILEQCKEHNKPFWRVILEDDMQERMVTEEESIEKMQGLYYAMKEADSSYDGSLLSASRLVGGDGHKMSQALQEGKVLGGPFMGKVIAKALKMGESNACMKKIVAAPTAGSCGVIPAVLISYEEEYKASLQEMIEAMYVASGIGQIIGARAFLSGAAGGCQAEIGSASAMAAAALTYLNGGDYESIVHGAAMSLKNLLGLVCDTVGGLVEVPCVKRNVIGAVNAIASADMAVAGIRSQIPPDEVIDAMREVGEALPKTLRETGEGGLGATPTGMKIKNRLLDQS